MLNNVFRLQFFQCATVFWPKLSFCIGLNDTLAQDKSSVVDALASFCAWSVFGRYGGHADVCLARGIRPERSGTGRDGQQLALDGHEALLHAGLHQHLRRGVRAESGAERGAAHDGSDAHVQLQSAGELQHLQSSGEQLHGRGEQLQSTASTEYASPPPVGAYQRGGSFSHHILSLE